MPNLSLTLDLLNENLHWNYMPRQSEYYWSLRIKGVENWCSVCPHVGTSWAAWNITDAWISPQRL